MEKMSGHIWYEVTEDTRKLMITNENSKSSNLKSFKWEEKHEKLRRVVITLESPECVIINLFDHPDIELGNFEGMIQNLPNLEVLFICNQKVPNLIGLPKNLPKLKNLTIVNTSLKTLKGIPNALPSLERLRIDNVPLESIKYMPKSIPRLKTLDITRTSIETLEYFPVNAPVLQEIHLVRNKLISLKGIPSEIPFLKKLNVLYNKITSLEHLPSKFNKRYLSDRDRQNLILNPNYIKLERNIELFVWNNPIRTLSGIKFPDFFKRIIHYEDYYKNFQLCPSAIRLIDDYHNKKIPQDTYKVDMGTGEIITHELIKDSAKYDTIVEFYRKTPMELAQQYIENPESLTNGEIERLSWEGGYQERQLLESNLSSDILHPNLVVEEISLRLSHELPSGLSILK